MRVTTRGGRVRVVSVEFFAAETCNLRCRHCSASSPYLNDPNFPDLDQLSTTLRHLSPVLSAGQMKILGGEPLLNPHLTEIMALAKASGIFDRLRVTTNGILLTKANDEFWNLADVVEVSVYPSTKRAVERALADARPRAALSSTELEVKLWPTFHRSITETPLDADLVQKVFANCSEAHEWSCHQIHGAHFYRCSRVPTLDLYLSRCGIEHPDFTREDGLLIDSRGTLFADLEAYLASETPLRACSFCLGTCGEHLPHEQLSGEELKRHGQGAEFEEFSPSWIAATDPERPD